MHEDWNSLPRKFGIMKGINCLFIQSVPSAGYRFLDLNPVWFWEAMNILLESEFLEFDQ